MTIENEVQQADAPLTAEQTAAVDQQASDDFAAGFNRTRGVETKDSTVAAEPQTSNDDRTNSADPEKELIVGDIPISQLRGMLDRIKELDTIKGELGKTRDTLNGKFGELNRSIQSLQTGKAGKIDKSMFKAITDRYGEDYAEALAADMAGLPIFGAGEKIELPNFEEMFKTRDENLRRELTMEYERKALLRQHKDFYQEIETPEFKTWLDKQPVEKKNEFHTSIDSDWLGDLMKDFKDQKAGTTRVDPKKQDKQKVLEQAVNPKGNAAAKAAMSDEDAFRAGFKAVRGKAASY